MFPFRQQFIDPTANSQVLPTFDTITTKKSFSFRSNASTVLSSGRIFPIIQAAQPHGPSSGPRHEGWRSKLWYPAPT